VKRKFHKTFRTDEGCDGFNFQNFNVIPSTTAFRVMSLARAKETNASADLAAERLAKERLVTERADLRAILDDLNVGIVLLDQECQVLFVNRAFRRFWRISDAVAESRQSFVRLMYHGRGQTASSMSHYRLGEYLARQMKLIQAGKERPLHIRLTNGEVIQFRCKALPNGGRLLTYGNVSELAQQADALERLACVDGLTGLNNRRHFLVLAETEWSRFKRYGRPLAALVIDIDHFKAVNDTYGHDAGDEVIKAVAEVLRTHKRTSDIVGRLGGEEFVLLLPEATLDKALAAGERFRQLIADCAIVASGRRITVTISVGASVARADQKGFGEVLKEADIALYEAKRSGRNRVCRFDPDRPATLVAVAS
jgi:diguanylate cyclase (GGDEF)-like protein